jgi:hypothetical protein
MARTGKIAQLPFEIREDLNGRLLDGRQGPDLLAWLNSLPAVRTTARKNNWQVPEITDGNLSEWRAGGFADWLNETLKIRRMELWADTARRLQLAAGGSLAGAAADIAAGRIMEALMAMDDADTVPAEGEEPKEGPDIIGMGMALAKLRAAETLAAKLTQDGDRLNLARKKLEQDAAKLRMAQEKFRREMAGNFLDWSADERVKAIAAGKATREETVSQLSMLADLFYGQPPEDAGPPAELL